MISPADIIREARALLGTPWVHQGRTPLGVDCIGFLWLVATRAGVDLPGLGIQLPRRYGRVADRLLYDLVSRQCTPGDVGPGRFGLFRFPEDQYPRHFALITERDTLIHAEARVHGKVIEHGYRAHWLARTDSVWNIPGVRYE